jgi:hypothetical protein
MTENYALGGCGRERKGLGLHLIKVLSRHFFERDEENHERSLSEHSVAKPKFGQGHFLIMKAFDNKY